VTTGPARPGLAAYWKASCPGELPGTPVLPEPLTTGEFELEGQMLRAVSVGWGDTEFSTVLHVPSAAAVIGGDVVYNGVHMMTAETDEKPPAAWIASATPCGWLSLRRIAAVDNVLQWMHVCECVGAAGRHAG
jgi:hypothetical protein